MQSQLEGTENRIAVARRDYIEAVRVYNTELKTFPGILWASTFFRANKPMAEFAASDECADAAASEILTHDVRRGARRLRGRHDRRPHLPGASQRAVLGWPSVLSRCWARRSPPSRSISRRSPAASSIRPTSSRPRPASAIEPKLADLETKSGIQLVVATVSSLEGQEIEPYANELFRTWKLGEKDKNNGVLLLVAPNEHRVRIEVGYGLEGTLTDALSKVIITNAITPRFKAGDFGGGISRGVDDIITVLTTDASEWQKRPSLRLDKPPAVDPSNWLIIGGIFIFIILLRRLARLSLVCVQHRCSTCC